MEKFIQTEVNDSMPTGGIGFNMVSSLGEPVLFFFRDNHAAVHAGE